MKDTPGQGRQLITRRLGVTVRYTQATAQPRPPRHSLCSSILARRLPANANSFVLAGPSVAAGRGAGSR